MRTYTSQRTLYRCIQVKQSYMSFIMEQLLAGPLTFMVFMPKMEPKPCQNIFKVLNDTVIAVG